MASLDLQDSTPIVAILYGEGNRSTKSYFQSAQIRFGAVRETVTRRMPSLRLPLALFALSTK